eukprot:TRINITY_DN5778_c0_g3_i8.p1 TRINITY_DN5778_c0_g3~~TRINITY_DN5778_c0_g3_i8.p1  ORF type:complete len:585 (-),score=89.31 TRINITY_DN5778_c0_g3_i8:211-1893(-)
MCIRDRYLITALIGQGQFGKVFKGINESTNQQLAIKAVQKQILNTHAKLKQLFIQEVTIMKKIDNENIIKLIDYLESQSTCYIIMEFCNQGDLESLLKKQNHLCEDEAITHFQEILNGFQCLHKNNIIHRDFKAANVMINDGVFKIGDFGFAKQTAQAGTILGTPLYMSPELLSKTKTYTNKTDIWSIGVLFYQMLFGTFPFDGNSESDLLKNILQQSQKINLEYNKIKISEPTKDLLRKMLRPDPSQRIEWADLFSHQALNKEEKIEGSLENMWTVSQFNIKNKNKLIDQANYYKSKQFQNTQQINPEDYYGQVQEQQAPTPQQIEEEDQIKKLLFRYQHEKKIYEQIGSIMKNAFPLLPEQEHLVFYFILSKQYLILSNNLMDQLKKKQNVFSNPNFTKFTNSKYYNELVDAIQYQFNNLHQFFKVFLVQITKLMQSYEFAKKNYANIKNLQKYVNENLEQTTFSDFYQQILREYYLKINEKAQFFEGNNKNEAFKFYRLCYEVQDCILMPSNYPFECKDEEGNIVIFDFHKYNSKEASFTIEQLKEEIEIKFKESLQ